jgi:hypothetical protein
MIIERRDGWRIGWVDLGLKGLGFGLDCAGPLHRMALLRESHHITGNTA